MAKSVLLVEDDGDLRKLYKTVFRRAGFEVFEAEDGQVAIDRALIDKPSAIILDLMLPRQGGLGALKIFRTMPETKYTPILILTALPNPEYEVVSRGLVQGFFLKTQIAPKDLVYRVKQIVGVI